MDNREDDNRPDDEVTPADTVATMARSAASRLKARRHVTPPCRTNST